MGFDAILGHERQKTFLSSLIERERLPHALLFSGMEGVGKGLIALELSRYILCQSGLACGECRSCRKIGSGSHPDVIVVRGNPSIGIDMIRGSREKRIRGIEEEVYEYPYEGSRRVIIIDGVETMTSQAANAFLKTLEEPPPFNLFILVTSAEETIPVTIRSRCIRIGFGPLGREELKGFFEATGLEAARADLLSSISHGSIQFGLFWAKQENFALRRRMAEVLLGIRKGYAVITSLSERLSSDATAIPLHLSFLLSLFRDLWVCGRSGETSLVVNRDLEELFLQRPWKEQWISSSIKRIQESQRTMRYNINRWLGFENLMLQIAGSA